MAKRQKNPFGVREDTIVTYQIWELHNKVEPRLVTAYFNKKAAYKRMKELQAWDGDEHDYYIKEFEVRK